MCQHFLIQVTHLDICILLAPLSLPVIRCTGPPQLQWSSSIKCLCDKKNIILLHLFGSRHCAKHFMYIVLSKKHQQPQLQESSASAQAPSTALMQRALVNMGSLNGKTQSVNTCGTDADLGICKSHRPRYPSKVLSLSQYPYPCIISPMQNEYN